MKNKPTSQPKITRRDRCYLVSKRMVDLDLIEASSAWYHLSGAVEGMGEYDHLKTPKFRDLLNAIRRAVIFGRRQAKSSRALTSTATVNKIT